MSVRERETSIRVEPRANPLLIGQDEAIGSLRSLHRSGRLPHALIFSGPRGIGKATLAFRFVRWLLAEGGAGGGLFAGADVASDNLALDPSHPAFRRVASGGHPDLITVERTVNEKTGKRRDEIVIEDARAVGNFLRLTPAEGGWRIVVVDAADELNRNSANALLKVLEEPPRQALLLLVAHAPGRLLPTIRSRCRTIALRRLEDGEVADLLRRYRTGLDAEEEGLLVQLAEGSIGRALDLADAGGAELYREVVSLISALPALDMPAVHGLGERLARSDAADDFRTVADLIGWWLARMVRGAARGALPSEIVPGEAAAMRRLLDRAGLDRWVALWEKITLLFARADGLALDRKQVVLTAFLDFAATARE
ncbi:MAG TPA: DNA polymerase III subunit delta' [Alphaproteobacteria bacterium]|nr:DNA polymerase III subunit delta' [Alphaproteobacteria bacterium]